MDHTLINRACFLLDLLIWNQVHVLKLNSQSMKPRNNHQGNTENHQYLMWTNSTFLRLLCYSYLYGRIDPSIIVKLLDLEHNLHLTVWFTWPLGGVEVRFCFGSCQDFGCSSLKLTYCQWSDISAQLVHWNFIYLEPHCRLKIWKKL